jgi:hypothetical protein
MSTKDIDAIAGVLAGNYACASETGRIPLWRTTLSLADLFARECADFDRKAFYLVVFGADHFTARDELVGYGKPMFAGR